MWIIFHKFFTVWAGELSVRETSKENISESQRVKSLSGCAGKTQTKHQTSDFFNLENRTETSKEFNYTPEN